MRRSNQQGDRPLSSFARPRFLVPFVLVLALGAAATFALTRSDSGQTATAKKGCPSGYIKADHEEAEMAGAGEKKGACLNIDHPELPEDIAKFGEAAALRFGGERPGQMRTALRQKAHLADDPNVSGANGTWQALGKGPLISNDPTYPSTYGGAYGKLAGRISDYAYDTGTNRLFATAAQGGVWQSNDRGDNWYSISDGQNGLPIQSVGGIAWTPAGGDGGTLVVATGDHAFSNDYSGMGVYYTTDEGKSWKHAKGVPDGGLSFQVVVDPTEPKRLYAATGLGLFRSDDAGRNWSNVKLPTGDCAGDSFRPNCFFANIVTGVQVQGTDTLGHKGGAVVAAVGWRAGQYPNFNDKPQAPANGIYRSDTGEPGSFTKIGDDAGITPTAQFGRAELGASHGPGQDSRYVYALVQNAKYFTDGTDVENDVPSCDPVIEAVCPNSGSVFDGVYVSADFGKTWTVMEDHQTMPSDVGNGSAINQLRPLGLAAGYQVTYNEWIKVDPTQKSGDGVPTHLVFGMEEIWQNDVPGQPMDGRTRFTSFAPYNQAGACLLVLLAETCSTSQEASQKYTTHPDQHGAILLPDGKGGVDLVAGNDGGNYRQHSDSGHFTNDWGEGNQAGFNTLLPYGVAMAKDRTVYAGLQDNGEMRIDPKTGVQNMVYGGDGVFTLVNPDNSDEVIEEYPGARISVSKDGGKSWGDMSPNVDDADFVTPIVQDSDNYKHVVTGGRQIVETTSWLDTTSNCSKVPGEKSNSIDCSDIDTDWKVVFDLGTFTKPGDPKAEADQKTDPGNHVVSLRSRGAAVYAGFCGSCDPVKLHGLFHTGIATNVGGDKPPATGSVDGWHVAKASGLPNRIITGVEIDPADNRTVYVTLGASASRPFAPLGSLGEDSRPSEGGYVYKSTDAGETFTNITGDLPKVQATWVRIKGGQLVVSNAVGVFISKDLTGAHWAELGSGFPNSPVYSFEMEPGDGNKIVVASFGRGVWEYDFTKRAGSGVLGVSKRCGDNTGPTSRFYRSIKSAAKRKGRGLVLAGTSAFRKCKGGPAGKVKRVRATLELRVSKKRCRFLTKKGTLGKTVSCKRKPKFFNAKGTGKWKFRIRGPLPPGRYLALVVAKDNLGNTERRSAHRNFRHFRITAKGKTAQGWHGRQPSKVG